ncbi:hypothetical protein SCLCIDRAFT_1213127 [Scleroderma citrinum Foug A]|uniref:Secreted protein n=1 Tax=Scleroderma citrinum Foug A TaxID=1036808 RepID=A0A0C3E9J6_9AGAM|nr:hypothetical protein SCLCIDRAFT_1213127 [Scleroderma citrinum Foug A]
MATCIVAWLQFTLRHRAHSILVCLCLDAPSTAIHSSGRTTESNHDLVGHHPKTWRESTACTEGYLVCYVKTDDITDGLTVGCVERIRNMYQDNGSVSYVQYNLTT